MNKLSDLKQAITSFEIASLIEHDHDNVNRSIERLVKEMEINIKLVPHTKILNSGLTYSVNMRDSYVIVALLSPKFIGKLFDYWDKLYEKSPKVEITDLIVKSYSRQKLIIEKNNRLLIAINQSHIDAGEVTLIDFLNANELIEFSENQFLHWMIDNRLMNANNEPFRDHIKSGYFSRRPVEEMPNGGFRYETGITPRGKVGLAKIYLSYLNE